jgi:putative transposase
MKQTILVKHNIDYSTDLAKARQVAEWAVQNKYQVSSKHVKHIGLASAIANQVLKKYGMNRTIKDVKHVKLTIPRNGDGIRIMADHRIYVACIKTNITCWYNLAGVEKIDQIEVDNEFYYITFDVSEATQYEPNDFIGIDLNATGHSAVIAINDRIIKRGKQAPHIKRTYAAIRKKLRRKKQYASLKQVKNREARRSRDLNHKLSREVVDLAKANLMGIRLEDLKNIRERTNQKSSKKSRGITNNWNFFQLRQVNYRRLKAAA